MTTFCRFLKRTLTCTKDEYISMIMVNAWIYQSTKGKVNYWTVVKSGSYQWFSQSALNFQWTKELGSLV